MWIPIRHMSPHLIASYQNSVQVKIPLANHASDNSNQTMSCTPLAVLQLRPCNSLQCGGILVERVASSDRPWVNISWEDQARISDTMATCAR